MKHLPVCCPRAAIAHVFCVSFDIRVRPRLSWSASPAPVRWVSNEVVDLLSSNELATPHATLQSARMPEHQMSHASTKAIAAVRRLNRQGAEGSAVHCCSSMYGAVCQ